MSSPPHPFFFSFFLSPRFSCSTAPQAFSRPDRVLSRPARADGCQGWPFFSGHPLPGAPAFTAIEHDGRLDGSGRLHSLSYGVVLLYSDHVCFFGRSCYEVHGACDSRINLYPAAPIRLAKVLLAWTIAQVDGAHLLNGILASANLRCGSTATHPTCPTHGCRNSARYRVRVAPCGTRPCSR